MPNSKLMSAPTCLEDHKPKINDRTTMIQESLDSLFASQSFKSATGLVAVTLNDDNQGFQVAFSTAGVSPVQLVAISEVIKLNAMRQMGVVN